MSAATLVSTLASEVGNWLDVDGWLDEGSCAGAGGELFFDRTDEFGHDRREADAKARCLSCPVLADCLRWALAAGEPAGVWAGGTTTAERLANQRALGIAS